MHLLFYLVLHPILPSHPPLAPRGNRRITASTGPIDDRRQSRHPAVLRVQNRGKMEPARWEFPPSLHLRNSLQFFASCATAAYFADGAANAGTVAQSNFCAPKPTFGT